MKVKLHLIYKIMLLIITLIFVSPYIMVIYASVIYVLSK